MEVGGSHICWIKLRDPTPGNCLCGLDLLWEIGEPMAGFPPYHLFDRLRSPDIIFPFEEYILGADRTFLQVVS